MPNTHRRRIRREMHALTDRIAFEQQIERVTPPGPHHGTIVTDPRHHIRPPRRQPLQPADKTIFTHTHRLHFPILKTEC